MAYLHQLGASDSAGAANHSNVTGSAMAPPLFLYSTNTWLAYAIAENYYNHIHYVWCCPYFDGRAAPNSSAIPPTASPFDIYGSLHEEVIRGDKHSAAVDRNKIGILKGADAKKLAGVITSAQYSEIASVVNAAELRDFKPLLYVIPFALVSATLVTVPVSARAHPMSIEYRLEALPRDCFDILEFRRI